MNHIKSHKVFVFVVPALLIYGIFCLFPILNSLYFSLLKWNGTQVQRTFIGIKNYIDLISDEYFFASLRNSFILVGYGLLIKLPLALVLAVIVNYPSVRLKKVFRITSFMPCIISTAAIALMWKQIYNPDFGLINAFLDMVGLRGWKHAWLSDTNIAVYFALIPSIWASVGFNFVLYSSGLASIPIEINEAAMIDGATYPKLFKAIQLPMLRDIIIISLVLDLTGSLKNFDMIWVLTGGGPSDSTHLLATYMYKQSFMISKFGYGSAIACVIFLLSMVYTLILNFLTRKNINE